MIKFDVRIDEERLKKVLAVCLFVGGCILAGYYGASLAQAKKDMNACRVEMSECHMEWSVWGFEVIGTGELEDE